MDWFKFGLLLQDNIPLYTVILTLSILIYVFLFRKIYLSILDPLIFSLIFSVFGFSVVWFLYFTNSIELRYLLSYIFTQTAFWLGLFTFKALNTKGIFAKDKTVILEKEELFVLIFFWVTSGLYIFLQLLSYIVIGVPILLGTHVDIYSNSGGWGIIGKIIDIDKPVSIFLLFYFLLKPATSIYIYLYRYFFIFLLVVFFALSDSKGDFMSVGLIFFCFLLLNASKYKTYFNNFRKTERVIILSGIFFAYLTIFIQAVVSGGDTNYFYIFMFRLIASGDIYFFSYVNGLIEHVSGEKPFLAMFGEVFSTLRIVPRDQQPKVLGYQFYQMFFDSDTVAGPNSRHNVFGYVYFGFYGSIVFSYLIGLLLSVVRNKLFYVLKKNIVGQVVFLLLYLNLVSLETDPPMAFSAVESILTIFPFILGITFLIHMSMAGVTNRKAALS